MVVDSINTILINGKYRKQYFLHRQIELDVFNEIWIEGIGSLYGVLNSGLAGAIGGKRELLCFYENDTLKYQNPNYEICFISTYTGKDLDKKSQVVLYKNNLSPGLYFYRLSNNDMFIVSGKIIIL
ncbi:hypothetical protein ES705_38442 [subsurface metagenome]